jgi:sugar lactone lactonase YvrE
MKRCIGFLILMVLLPMFAGVAWADEDIIVKRGVARRFATLPEGVRFPEGITTNPETGNIYIGTFDFGPNTNKLLRFNKDGKLLAQIDFGGEPLLGLAFNPKDNKVYICNVGTLTGFGPSRIQRVAADFTDTTAVEEVAAIPGIGPPPDRTVMNPDGSADRITFGNNAPAPNALAFGYKGKALFVSDSFQGAIFRINNPGTCETPCAVTPVKHDGLLATAGFPPFGANGLAFGDERTLFIANTGDDRVLQTDVESGIVSGDIAVFAESINGADGLAYDGKGILWVAANQADEVVALNRDGRVIAKMGDFLGIRRNGSVRGLLFPASLVIVRRHKERRIIVTNLALPLTGAMGDEPEEDVTTYTVAEIPIPFGLREHE